MDEKIFRVMYDNGSATEYTIAEFGSKFAEESRLAVSLEIWDGYNYIKIFPKEVS